MAARMEVEVESIVGHPATRKNGEETNEEEVTVINSPLDLHMKQIGIDPSLPPPEFPSVSAQPRRRKTGSVVSGGLSGGGGGFPKVTVGGGGEIVWRDGVFLEGEDDCAAARRRYSSATTSSSVSWWRRCFSWAPAPVEMIRRKMKQLWRSGSGVEWLKLCVRFFGFTDQLKTYMSRVQFHLFDRMIHVGFESVLTEEDEHFMRNYWQVEKEKQNQLNRQLRRNGMLHPTMIRLGLVLWASLSYLFYQYVFSTSSSSTVWVPAIFIVCFLILLTPETITMWQHRVAVRRANATLAAFEAYLARSKELASTTRLAMKLIHELDLVEAGFTFMPSMTGVGVEAPAARSQTTEQLVVIKGSVFVALRQLFHSHRSATRDLMLALPLGVDLDTPALYVAHISLSEFGASLTLPCVTGNEQHLSALRQSTDDFASSALKAMAQLAHLQSSELVRRLILSASPQSYDINSLKLVTDISTSFCRNLTKDLIPTISSLRRSYDFHRCQILARESASTSTTASSSHLTSASPKAALAAAIHALDLRLQSALLRSRELERNSFVPNDNQIDRHDEDEEDSSASSRNPLIDCKAENDDSTTINETIQTLERLGLEIDAAKAVWEDAVFKAKNISTGNADAASTNVVPSSPVVFQPIPAHGRLPAELLPEIRKHVVVDEVFEGTVDEAEALRRKKARTEGLENVGDVDYAVAMEERERKKREREEMKRVLTELRPRLKERADMWEEREKKAVEGRTIREEEENLGASSAPDTAINATDEGVQEQRVQEPAESISPVLGSTKTSLLPLQTAAPLHQILEEEQDIAYNSGKPKPSPRISLQRLEQPSPSNSEPDIQASKSLKQRRGSDEEKTAGDDIRLRISSETADEVSSSIVDVGSKTFGRSPPARSLRSSTSQAAAPARSPRSSVTQATRSPVVPARNRSRKEKASLARWSSENDVGGGGGDNRGASPPPGGLVRMSWAKSMELLNVPTRRLEIKSVSTENLTPMTMKVVDIDIDTEPKEEESTVMNEERYNQSNSEIEAASLAAMTDKEARSSEEKEQDTTDFAGGGVTGILSDTDFRNRYGKLPPSLSLHDSVCGISALALSNSIAKQSAIADSASPTPPTSTAACSLSLSLPPQSLSCNVIDESVAALPTPPPCDVSGQPVEQSDAALPPPPPLGSISSNHQVVDLLIVNGGNGSKEIRFGIEAKMPPSPKPRVLTLQSRSDKGGYDALEGDYVVRDAPLFLGLSREKSFDVETDSSSDEGVHSPRVMCGDADSSTRKDDSSTDGLVTPQTHNRTSAESLSMTGGGRESEGVRGGIGSQGEGVRGGIVGSLERSRPSSLAGFLAPSPPARTLDAAAAGTFAFNKNLAQMAVAKSAEFRGFPGKAPAASFAYVEETFGDDLSSDEDEDDDDDVD